mgnify:FL=1
MLIYLLGGVFVGTKVGQKFSCDLRVDRQLCLDAGGSRVLQTKRISHEFPAGYFSCNGSE